MLRIGVLDPKNGGRRPPVPSPRKRGEGDEAPCLDHDHAPGKPSRRLLMMLSWTSEVPPSIEFALLRSQSRAALPSLERLPSHSSASEPPPSIMSSWRRLLSSAP